MGKLSVQELLQKAKAIRLRVIAPLGFLAIAVAAGAFAVTTGMPFSIATKQATASPAASTPTGSLSSAAQHGVDPYVVWMWQWNSQKLHSGEFQPRQQNIDPKVYVQLPWAVSSSTASGSTPVAGPSSGLASHSIDPNIVAPWAPGWKNADRGRFNGQSNRVDPKIYTAPFSLPATPPSRLG